jgi:hypothetical protein
VAFSNPVQFPKETVDLLMVEEAPQSMRDFQIFSQINIFYLLYLLSYKEGIFILSESEGLWI